MRCYTALLALFVTLGLGVLASPTEAEANPGLSGDRPAVVALTTSFEIMALTLAPLKEVVPAADSGLEHTPVAAVRPAPQVAERAPNHAATVIEAGDGIDQDALALWGFWLVTVLAAIGLAAWLLERAKETPRRHHA